MKEEDEDINPMDYIFLLYGIIALGTIALLLFFAAKKIITQI